MTTNPDTETLAFNIRRVAEAAIVGLLMGVNLLLATEMLWPGMQSLFHGDGLWVGWIGLFRFWEMGRLAPWVIGFGGAVATAFAVSWGKGRTWWFRAVGGVQAVGCLAALVAILLTWPTYAELDMTELGKASQKMPVPWPQLITVVAGMGCGAAVLFKVVSDDRLGTRWRVTSASAVAVLITLLGWGTLADTWKEYESQKLPGFTVKLVAARRLYNPKEILPAGTKVVVRDKIKYVLNPKDSFQFTQQDVKRVRWREFNETSGRSVAVSIRLRSGLYERLAKRSRRLTGQAGYDTIWVNNKLVTVAPYRGILYDGILLLTTRVGHDADPKKLYRALTRGKVE